MLFFNHIRSEQIGFRSSRLIWLERGSEPVSAEAAPDDPETTIKRLADLRKQIESKKSQSNETQDESGIREMEREFDASKAKLQELLGRENIREKLRNSSDLNRLFMLDEIMPGALKGLYCKELGAAESGTGKQFLIDLPQNSLADAALGLGMIDFRENGEGNQPQFVMVKKPDGTVQFGKRGIREFDRSGGKTTERVGYYDVQSGDYLEIHGGYTIETYADQAQLQVAYEKYSATQPESSRRPLNTEELKNHKPAAESRERAANEGFAEFIKEEGQRAEQIMVKLNEIPADQITEHLMQMPWRDLHALRVNISENGANTNYGPKLTAYLKQRGVDVSMTRAEELRNELIQATESPNAETERLINAMGGKEPFTETMMKLAGHESAYRPFAVSSTGCIGLFQFNRGNARHYQINPVNTKEAVKGVIGLWADNLEGLNKNGYGNATDLTERLLVAHNRGLSVAAVADLAQVGKDIHGNPTALAYAEKVKNLKTPEFSDQSAESASA